MAPQFILLGESYLWYGNVTKSDKDMIDEGRILFLRMVGSEISNSHSIPSPNQSVELGARRRANVSYLNSCPEDPPCVLHCFLCLGQSRLWQAFTEG